MMIALLKGLEPRRYDKEDMILRDLDEVEEITFITKGDVSILLFNTFRSLSATRSTTMSTMP